SRCRSNACRCPGCRTGSAERSCQEGSGTCRCAGRKRCISDRGGSEIFQGNRRQGPDAHLRRSIQRQQSQQREWRYEMDRQGRRLLQRVQQEAEGLSYSRRRARPDEIFLRPRSALLYEQFFGQFQRRHSALQARFASDLQRSFPIRRATDVPDLMISMVQGVLGLASGVLVGFSLGLVGGGGSILAVPLMVYVVGVPDPHVAIGTSAIAVGANAAVNLSNHARGGTVGWDW